MKKKYFLLLLAILPSYSKKEAATINDKPIYLEEFTDGIESLIKKGEKMPDEKDLKNAFVQLREKKITEAVIYEEAQKQKDLKEDPEYKKVIEEMGRQILMGVYLKKEKEKLVASIAESDVKARLDEFTKKSGKQVLIQQVSLSNQDLVKRFKNQPMIAEKNSTFDKVMKENRLVVKNTNPVPEAMFSEFQSMKEGEVRVIEPKEGPESVGKKKEWILIRLLKREDLGRDLKDQLAGRMKEDLINEKLAKHFESLMEKASIKRFDMNGNVDVAPPKSSRK